MVAPATITVYDNIYDVAGKAAAGATVTCVLNSSQETTSGGLIGPRQQSTVTDSSGRFAFTVVCNDLLSPSGSTYTILTPFRSYDIAPQSANGSSQQTTAANVIVNVPTALQTIPSLSGTYSGPADLAIRSLTLLSGSSYAPNLPGDATTLTPAGVGAGKFWDWGGMVYHAMGTGAKGDGVTDDTTKIQTGINTATTASLPFYMEGESISFLTGQLSIPSGAKLVSLGLAHLKLKNSVNADWLKFADVVHTDTHISGLYLDGNGSNQSTASQSVIAAGYLGPVNLGHNRTVIENNTIINPAIHGIFITESTTGQSNNPKFINRNVINGHGEAGSTGFGIYTDYVGNVIVEGNFVTNTHAYDCIENGHSGPSWITNNGSITCVYNIVVGGQLQFPFCDNARLEGNFVLNSKIANDANTANNVAIVGNTVFAPSTSIPAGSCGISYCGANGLVEGNYISVGQNNGIGSDSNGSVAQSGTRILGNIVTSTNAGNSGTGIMSGGGTSGTSNDCIVANNLVTGKFVTGIASFTTQHIIADNRISLTGATNGIKQFGSATMGFTTGTNVNIHDNNISGATNPLVLPTPGTDSACVGLQVRNNQGVTAITHNGFACGLPAYRSAQTAAIPVTACTVTAPNDGVTHMYLISGGVTITTLGSGVINLEVTYTDDNNTARTCILPVCAEAGTFAVAANTADAWKGTIYIMAKPNTVLTVLTAGTFTGCTYNWSGLVEMVA